MRTLLTFSLLTISLPALAGEVTLGGRTFVIPDNYALEIAATSPQTQHPIMADFDDEGRLFVGEASGVQAWKDAQPADRKDDWHRLVRLTDRDGDGRFDHRVVVATFDRPVQGVQCLRGDVFVAAPPILWKLSDPDRDGVFRKREKWFEQTTPLSGCLNDLHGPVLGPDGWLYWTKGAHPEVTYGSGNSQLTTTARHIFRRHPDGRDSEPVMTGGMDNPVEIAFTRGGERLYTATNFQILGQPRRDGVAHALIGAIVPKDIASVFRFPWSTPSLYDAPLFQSGAIAVSGLIRCESAAWADAVVFTQFSGRRVTKLALTPSGGTFTAKPEDLLASDDLHFHPTDVLEDADGSLLVLDTGGWYLHCCPSSTFFRPEARGGIYRLRRKGAVAPADPRGLKLTWNTATTHELVARLGDARPAVRKRALHTLATHGLEVLKSLERRDGNSLARENAVWVASQIEGDAARQFVRTSLADADEHVKLAALNSISLRRDTAAAPHLLRVLEAYASDRCRRVAAEALGRCRVASAAPAFLAAYTQRPTDAALDHALGLALIEVANVDTTRHALTSPHGKTRRAALMALEQMPSGNLKASEVLPHPESDDALVREAAWWVAARHVTDWADDLAAVFKSRLSDPKLSDDLRRDIARHLGIATRGPQLQAWIVSELRSPTTPDTTKILLLKSMTARGGSQGLSSWRDAAIELIPNAHTSARLRSEAATFLAAMPPVAKETASQIDETRHRLRSLAERRDLPDAVRLDLLKASPASLSNLSETLFEFLLSRVAADQPLAVRGAAANTLAKTRLTDTQLLRFASAIKHLGADEMARAFEAFADCKDDTIGETLIASLTDAAALGAQHPSRLRSLFAPFGDAVRSKSNALLEKLSAADAELLKRTDRVLALAGTADAERGLAVFQGKKASCVSCHVAVLVGGHTGPSLVGLGQRRTERDILESVLFPSASLAQGFETWTARLDDGRVVSGVLLADRPDEITLGLTTGEQRLPRASLESLERGKVSVMPAGLDRTLSDQDLADLVAYLKSLR